MKPLLHQRMVADSSTGQAEPQVGLWKESQICFRPQAASLLSEEWGAEKPQPDLWEMGLYFTEVLPPSFKKWPQMLLLMLMRAVTTRNTRSRRAALTRAKALMAQDLGKGTQNKPQQLAADFVTALLYCTVCCNKHIPSVDGTQVTPTVRTVWFSTRQIAVNSSIPMSIKKVEMEH